MVAAQTTVFFKRTASFFGATLLLLTCATVQATALADTRVALVIGNSDYENATELANPANDASDIAAALNELGFEVVLGLNLDNRGLRDKVREFGTALRGADVAMLFYAGHAMQVNGRNYLAPVDTRLEYESDLDFETIPLQFIQRQMEREAKTQLIFIDACRDNPLTRSFQAASRSNGAGKGLAEEKLSTSGIMIAFATSPDRVALDGSGRNSPFTRALLDNIRRPGVEISTLMTDVRVQVKEDTDGAQIPWINSALLGRFYFNPAATGNPAQAAGDNGGNGAPQTAGVGTSPQVEEARIAALAWEAVADSDSIQELETFTSLYGDSFYGKLAKIRIDSLMAKREDSQTARGQIGEEAEPDKIDGASLQPAEPEPSEKTEQEFDLRAVTIDIQEELARLNCNPGKADGIWGKRSAAALDKFAKATKQSPVANQPQPALLTQLRDFEGKGCPKIVRKAAPKKQPPAKAATRSTSLPQPAQQQPAQQQKYVVQQPTAQPQQRYIVQQPQQPQPGVVVQQAQPGVVQQPQPKPPGIIGGALVGGALACIVAGC